MMRDVVLSSAVLAAMASAVVMSACSSRTQTTSAGSPRELCNSTLEALALAFTRCGRDYQVAYEEQLQAIVGGDCANVSNIRDEEELETCRKTLATVPCSDLESGKLDPTCALQLRRSK